MYEKDFKEHKEKYKQVLDKIARLIVKYPELSVSEMLDSDRYSHIPRPEDAMEIDQNERLFAERVGKIIFNMKEDDPYETDLVVVEAKKKCRAIFGMNQ